jgi:SAM-dependent methyltransferase
MNRADLETIEAIGKRYEESISRDIFRHYMHRRKSILTKVLGQAKRKACLDVGSATGEYLQLFPSHSLVVGLDLSIVELKMSKQKFPNYPVVRADAATLPFRDRVFDLILVLGLLHHVPYRLSMTISEIKRVLEGSGIVVVDEPNGYNPAWRYEMRTSYLDRGRTCPIPPRLLRAHLGKCGLRTVTAKFYGFVPNVSKLFPCFRALESLVERSPVSFLCTRFIVVAKGDQNEK